jgi:hypothetical protein
VSVNLRPTPSTTKPARVAVEVRLAPRVIEAARGAAARCGTTVPALIGELLEVWLSARRCRHGAAGTPDPPEAAA